MPKRKNINKIRYSKRLKNNYNKTNKVQLLSLNEINNDIKYLTYDEIIQLYKLTNIETVDDLLALINIPYDKRIPSNIIDILNKNINFDKIYSLIDPLLDLNNLIGMKSIKIEIVSLIPNAR